MGVLPFFACSIPHFSVEEFTPSRCWFAEGQDGPWEWRMEAARRGAVACGKLFSKKAGLVSREWYPDLANYRRNGCDFDARCAVTEDVLGTEVTRGAYSRSPEESKARIIFEWVWKVPSSGIEKLSRYRAVLSPDFSIYLEMAPVMQMYHIYGGCTWK